MSGWRIGMLASNPQFIEWILKVKSNIDSGMFRPLQMAATKALSCGQEWYDQLNEVYRNRRDIAEKIMKALGCSYDPSQAGLFVWGKIPDSATDAESLADEILYNAHVFITRDSFSEVEGTDIFAFRFAPRKKRCKKRYTV